MKRKIAAILAADAPQFSRLVAEDRARALAAADQARAVFSKIVARHDGRVFNTAGAGVFAEFASAVEALRCAQAVQADLRPAGSPLAYRIGITIGDVVSHDGDLLGDGVNIAARIAGQAPDWGIWISRTAFDQVRNKFAFDASEIGARQLKNIPEPVFIIALADHGRGHAHIGQRGGGISTPVLMLVAAAVVLAGAAAWFLRPVPRAPNPVPATAQPPSAGQTSEPTKEGPAKDNPAGSARDASGRVPNAASSSEEFDRPIKSQRCNEILERVQSGGASAEDRAVLSRECS